MENGDRKTETGKRSDRRKGEGKTEAGDWRNGERRPEKRRLEGKESIWEYYVIV